MLSFNINKNINTIIFDLGGVLLNIDFSRAYEEFEKLGFTDLNKMFGYEKRLKLFDDLEKGLIKENDFLNEVKQYVNHNTSLETIINAWNSIILDFPAEKINMLKQLKNKYDLFLLSNSNVVHFKYYSQNLLKNYNETFETLFKKAYFSFNYGVCKPEKKFFEIILNEQNLNPEKTLFVDDSLPNIEVAQQLGIKTIHVPTNSSFNLF